ncbi:hypothetical protein CBOM_00116 [Ceraceosorus bombacis]|uniref:Uncharacterized protein n=1 Tax=Ceraceosorus bombacis TaxID=401625 RepID=A0A0P1B9X5_9BASI|nr:hypothetical protein CBOM_00116 [Ceraceosorus bombacis]
MRFDLRLDEHASSPDVATPPMPTRRQPRTNAQRQKEGMHMARRIRSEAFAFPVPPSGGLQGLGLGLGVADAPSRATPEVEAAFRRAATNGRFPRGHEWVEDATTYINRHSPVLCEGTDEGLVANRKDRGSDTDELTGSQGWSPYSSVAPSPALGMTASTAPLIFHRQEPDKLRAPMARRTVSQPGTAKEEKMAYSPEPDEYPFPEMPGGHKRLSMTFSPLQLPKWGSVEHHAPSLAEQMAFACGLGSDLEWDTQTSAANDHQDSFAYTSASAYVTVPELQEEQTAELYRSWTSHIDAGAALADEATFWTGAGADLTRSNTTASTAYVLADSPILQGKLALSQNSPGGSVSSERSDSAFSQPSVASSVTSISSDHFHESSLSKSISIDQLFERSLLATPLKVTDSPQVAVTREGSPHQLADEFSYLADAALAALSPVPCQVFSPALTDDELGLIGTPAPMQSLPSPMPATQQIEPARLALASTVSCPAVPASYRPELVQEDQRLLRSTSERPSSMFESQPAASSRPMSVLERPRPGTRGSMLFGGAYQDVERAQARGSAQTQRRDSGTLSSEQRRPSVPARPCPPVPKRRSSLDMRNLVGEHNDAAQCGIASCTPVQSGPRAMSRNGSQAFWEETKHALGEKVASKPTSAALPDLEARRLSVSMAGIPISMMTSAQSAPQIARVPPSTSPATGARKELLAQLQAQAATMTRSKSELPISSAQHSVRRKPAGILTASEMQEIRRACKQKQDFLRAAATAGVKGPSDIRHSVHFDESVRLQHQYASGQRSTPRIVVSPAQSLPVPCTSKSTLRPKSAQSSRSVGGMSSSLSLPTLFVARTPSQRRRGHTGVPATEPGSLALAKLGISSGAPTRTSMVSVGGNGRGSSNSGKSDVKTPEGVILVVENVIQEESRVLVVM